WLASNAAASSRSPKPGARSLLEGPHRAVLVLRADDAGLAAALARDRPRQVVELDAAAEVDPGVLVAVEDDVRALAVVVERLNRVPEADLFGEPAVEIVVDPGAEVVGLPHVRRAEAGGRGDRRAVDRVGRRRRVVGPLGRAEVHERGRPLPPLGV